MSSNAISATELRTSLANLPDWGELIAREPERWKEARDRAHRGGRRILLATAVGGGTSAALAAFESLLAVALTLRGAQVTVLLCDQVLPACMNLEVLTMPDLAVVADNQFNRTPACQQCALTGRVIFDPLGLKVRRFSHYLGASDRWAMQLRRTFLPAGHRTALHPDRAEVGEHAQAGALRYLARSDLAGVKGAAGVLGSYEEAAMLTHRVMKRALAEIDPEACVSSHGLYIPYGIVGEVCRAKGIRYSAWNVAYRKHCFIFSHNETYHHALLDEPVVAWENMAWSQAREERLKLYLASRITGTDDWIWFFEKPENDVAPVFSRLGINPAKPAVLLLTNVLWDAQLHYRANAYPSMLAWILDTIEWFKSRPDLQLVIRVHPAEIRATLPSRQRVADELAKVYAVLPSNVFLIGPEEQISTYAIAQKCDSALIYGTKTGVELACMGIQVVVTGEAWVRGKGITLDASSPAAYRGFLESLPFNRRLPPEVQLRAYKYAYHFFFRRMIPVSAAQPALAGWPPFHVVPESLEQLSPGVDHGLDVICEGILGGSEFVFDRGV
jgi:hypothetical protein